MLFEGILLMLFAVFFFSKNFCFLGKCCARKTLFFIFSVRGIKFFCILSLDAPPPKGGRQKLDSWITVPGEDVRLDLGSECLYTKETDWICGIRGLTKFHELPISMLSISKANETLATKIYNILQMREELVVTLQRNKSIISAQDDSTRQDDPLHSTIENDYVSLAECIELYINPNTKENRIRDNMELWRSKVTVLRQMTRASNIFSRDLAKLFEEAAVSSETPFFTRTKSSFWDLYRVKPSRMDWGFASRIDPLNIQRMGNDLSSVVTKPKPFDNRRNIEEFFEEGFFGKDGDESPVDDHHSIPVAMMNRNEALQKVKIIKV